MDSWIEKKYLNLISPRLLQYRSTSASKFLVKFRCPFCGDSKKDPNKARGNCYESKGTIFYHCYNCGISTHSSKVIELIDPELYKQYIFEKFKGGKRENNLFSEKPVEKKKYIKFKGLPSIKSLDDNHPAKQYVINRKIPEQQFHNLFYTPKFYSWTNSIVPEKFNKNALRFDHPRLILPMINQFDNMLGFQGRSFDPKDDLRYITIMLNENDTKIFGLNNIDLDEHVNIVEGPIDSLFLENCIAMAGVNSRINFLKNSFTIILDNEPRNKDIISRMNKYIEMNYQICIWPDYMIPKDINEMVMNGYTSNNLENIIKENTFSGLSATLRLNKWKKV